MPSEQNQKPIKVDFEAVNKKMKELTGYLVKHVICSRPVIHQKETEHAISR